MTQGIINLLEEARSERGISIRQLSIESGVSLQYLYRVFRGEHAPSVETLVKVLDAMGKRIDVVDKQKPAKAG
jgi:transcriptional regulator with XRE-family HTH domain